MAAATSAIDQDYRGTLLVRWTSTVAAMGGRGRIGLTMIVALLAGAIVAPAVATSAGPAASHGRKCKRKHGVRGRRNCRLRARITIAPPFHDFGTSGRIDSAPTDFVISNAGRRPSGIPAASISGSGSRYFQINATTCASPLTAGATCTLTVQSVHNDGATGWAELSVSAAPGGSASVPLIVNLF